MPFYSCSWRGKAAATSCSSWGDATLLRWRCDGGLVALSSWWLNKHIKSSNVTGSSIVEDDGASWFFLDPGERGSGVSGQALLLVHIVWLFVLGTAVLLGFL
ncbi:hypothetical protein E2562_008067 [Oryza meyeriana var. granulata]|uniref:Uncharacterized protein n=1 Tax=Oryza meyeriana var. granulata TaxID=110450 RepID=A0A6G1DFC4_9ORYZ|nr:hypothetical protein E2562_008067 [Oryza meyeriana var. granulata]